MRSTASASDRRRTTPYRSATATPGIVATRSATPDSTGMRATLATMPRAKTKSAIEKVKLVEASEQKMALLEKRNNGSIRMLREYQNGRGLEAWQRACKREDQAQQELVDARANSNSVYQDGQKFLAHVMAHEKEYNGALAELESARIDAANEIKKLERMDDQHHHQFRAEEDGVHSDDEEQEVATNLFNEDDGDDEPSIGDFKIQGDSSPLAKKFARSVGLSEQFLYVETKAGAANIDHLPVTFTSKYAFKKWLEFIEENGNETMYEAWDDDDFKSIWENAELHYRVAPRRTVSYGLDGRFLATGQFTSTAVKSAFGAYALSDDDIKCLDMFLGHCCAVQFLVDAHPLESEARKLAREFLEWKMFDRGDFDAWKTKTFPDDAVVDPSSPHAKARANGTYFANDLALRRRELDSTVRVNSSGKFHGKLATVVAAVDGKLKVEFHNKELGTRFYLPDKLEVVP